MSLEVFVQRVPHVVPAQVALQAPFEQKAAVGGQMVSQLPQWLGSPWKLKHEIPQAP
jgi:hypothetical protein